MKYYGAVLFVLVFAMPLSAQEQKTIITGDQMQMKKGGKVLVFTGNAKVTRGNNILQADSMIQDKVSNIVEAAGNIRFQTCSSDKEPIYATSGKARYDISGEKGSLWENRPHIIYYVKDSTGPVHLFADELQFNKKNEEIAGSGQVEILTSSASVYAPSALFLQKEKKMTFSGNPQPKLIILQEKQQGTYTADRITMLIDRKKVIMEGSVHGKMSVNDTGNKP